MNEYVDLTYYQKSRDVILNRAKDYYENYKERLKEKLETNIETYLKKKIKKENMEKIDISMSEEKKKRLK